MGLDFPNSPFAKQPFPDPEAPPAPVWTYDGEKWTLSEIRDDLPVGTVMPFYQASAPVGWSKVTTQNDKVLRIHSESGGSSGGTNSFLTVMAQTRTGARTLARGELPTGIALSRSEAHNFATGRANNWMIPLFNPGVASLNTSALATGQNFYAAAVNPIYAQGFATAWHGTIASSTVPSTNTLGASHDHPIMMDVAYVDVILAVKEVESGTLASGTTLPFFQSAAPLGWVRLTDDDNKLLRVTSASGGVSGGNNPFTTVAAQTLTDETTLSLEQLPIFNSTTSTYVLANATSGWRMGVSQNIDVGWGRPGIGSTAIIPVVSFNTSFIGWCAAIIGTITVGGTSTNTGGEAHDHPLSLDIAYANVILARKR